MVFISAPFHLLYLEEHFKLEFERMLIVIIIISPSKEMTAFPQKTQRPPELIRVAEEIGASEDLTEDTELYQAITLYHGLQFRYLKEGLSQEDFNFLDDYLRILSARYGVIKPLDGIRHYRKDFTTKGLYKSWGDKIYQTLTKENHVILNLASNEYSKTITRYAADKDRIITINFFERTEEDEIKKHASISKKGRGQLVNYIARNRVTTIESIKGFNDLGYQFNEEHSDDLNWVFIRQKD